MQAPDENGYIHVEWPSKNIPHGGIFHTKKVEPTPERTQFLKILLEESKLSITQRKKDAWGLRGGGSEPQKKAARPKHQNFIRPCTSKRRSLSCIRASGDLEIDPYRPIQRIEDRDLMKRKLQEVMEWGREGKPKIERVKLKPEPLPITPRAQRSELINQIMERAEWLAEMEELGQAAPHRDAIRDQIAERMRAIEALGVTSEVQSSRSVVDEVMDSVRSSARSRKSVEKAAPIGSARSSRTACSGGGGRSSKRSTSAAPGTKVKTADENVAMFQNLTPLRKSPRRRC